MDAMTQPTQSYLRLVTDDAPTLEQRISDELDADALRGFAHVYHRARSLGRGWLIERARSKRWRKLFELARIEANAERELKHEARSNHYVLAEQLAEARRNIAGALAHLHNGDPSEALDVLTEAKAMLDA